MPIARPRSRSVRPWLTAISASPFEFLVPKGRAWRPITEGSLALQYPTRRGEPRARRRGRPQPSHGIAEMVDVDDLTEVVRPVRAAIRAILARLAGRRRAVRPASENSCIVITHLQLVAVAASIATALLVLRASASFPPPEDFFADCLRMRTACFSEGVTRYLRQAWPNNLPVQHRRGFRHSARPRAARRIHRGCGLGPLHQYEARVPTGMELF